MLDLYRKRLTEELGLRLTLKLHLHVLADATYHAGISNLITFFNLYIFIQTMFYYLADKAER